MTATKTKSHDPLKLSLLWFKLLWTISIRRTLNAAIIAITRGIKQIQNVLPFYSPEKSNAFNEHY